MAGTAPKHDSVEDLDRVAERVRALDPAREVEVLTDRRPLDIVRQIREARIVIGTSLHVRIVAAAYGLPRVTMRRTKPTRYAAHWDDQMPFDVRIGDFEDAIGAALAAGTRAEVRTGSERLSRLADDNVRAIVGAGGRAGRARRGRRAQGARGAPPAQISRDREPPRGLRGRDRPAPLASLRRRGASSSSPGRRSSGCATGSRSGFVPDESVA